MPTTTLAQKTAPQIAAVLGVRIILGVGVSKLELSRKLSEASLGKEP